METYINLMYLLKSFLIFVDYWDNYLYQVAGELDWREIHGSIYSAHIKTMKRKKSLVTNGMITNKV